MRSYDFLNYRLNWNDLLSLHWNLFYSLTDVRNFLENLFHQLVNNNLFLNSYDFINSNFLYSLSNNLFNHLWDLHNFFNNLSYWNNLLNNLFDWNRNLYWNDNLGFNFDRFSNLNCVVDKLFDLNLFRNLFNNLDYLFDNHFIVNNLLLISRNLNQLIHNPIDGLFNLYINVLHCLDLNWPLLNHRHLHNSFNLFDSFLNDNFWNNLLDDLWDLNHFLDNSWHHNNFLHNLLDFNDFWHFDHLLDDLLHWDLDFLNSVHMSNHLNNLLLDVFDWLWNLYDMVNDFLNLDDFRFSNDLRISEINLFNNSIL